MTSLNRRPCVVVGIEVITRVSIAITFSGSEGEECTVRMASGDEIVRAPMATYEGTTLTSSHTISVVTVSEGSHHRRVSDTRSVRSCRVHESDERTISDRLHIHDTTLGEHRLMMHMLTIIEAEGTHESTCETGLKGKGSGRQSASAILLLVEPRSPHVSTIGDDGDNERVDELANDRSARTSVIAITQ